jgi:pyruvate, water dikinase
MALLRRFDFHHRANNRDRRGLHGAVIERLAQTPSRSANFVDIDMTKEGVMNGYKYIRWFEDITNKDVANVGGKNASLGEMIRSLQETGVRVPDGFATTSDAYWHLLKSNDLQQPIAEILHDYHDRGQSLRSAGEAIRKLILDADVPDDLVREIRTAYRELSGRYDASATDVAVRSSATAEDLPHASFAGQQESFLNVQGGDSLIEHCRRCYASLFTDRAIAYRDEKGFDHMKVALSIGIQKMVRSDLAGAGVMFTLDTDSGFPDAVLINASWGLGESVVKGTVNPDQYMVFKPLLRDDRLVPIIEKRAGTKEEKVVYADGAEAGATACVPTSHDEQQALVLSDEEILQLARWAVEIERHYELPMDIEWAKDGESGVLFIVQARPETVHSRQQAHEFASYSLKERGERLLSGVGIGGAIATGRVCRVLDVSDLECVEEGSVLVTRMTDPDWVPVMRKVAAIVTDVGGRTCHAAIVSRELGIPAIVGTGEATSVLETGQEVTVSCAEGEEGYVYEGTLEFETSDQDVSELPKTRTKIMLNLASPDAALKWWRLPADGIGLARMEFIVAQWIKVHPMALVHLDQVEDAEERAEIERLTRGYDDRTEYFVDRLALGIAKLAASQYPNPVIVRTSDFKTNEYAHLIGGGAFEPKEENPMIGWRGASRYYDKGYRAGFALECKALKRVRESFGFANVAVMIPFCRTVGEADRVLEVMAENGLLQGDHGLQLFMMCEIPSNVVLVDLFASRFDGFSIGSNDLTQLVLGIDRDSARLATLFDERDEAVRRMIKAEIEGAHEAGCTVGICGEAPSDYPDFVDFLVHAGIDSMSLNPDSFMAVKQRVAEAEGRMASADRSASRPNSSRERLPYMPAD